MERIDNVIAETKKQLRAIELVVLVRVDESLRFVGTRIRTRMRRLRGTARPAPRKGRSKRSRPSLVAAAA